MSNFTRIYVYKFIETYLISGQRVVLKDENGIVKELTKSGNWRDDLRASGYGCKEVGTIYADSYNDIVVITLM